ncbi:hypothetical protein PHISCL_00155 [Aspergillus sclerotialis]|uniref:USP domain-containing protein n=1 Tax=Aspergillus sclerotialis TaxID=2070753 RepID=A0A3A2ZWN4_9EURO|nr:hypothetical protein PHISCL_00155 [Aspergillus sclerotialis]
MWEGILKQDWRVAGRLVKDSQSQDAVEFLTRFLDLLRDNFTTSLKEDRFCADVGCAGANPISKTDPSCILSCSFPNGNDGQDTTKLVTHHLRDTRGPAHCENCDQAMIRRSTIPTPPGILFIQANRVYQNNGNVLRNDTGLVTLEEVELDLQKDGSPTTSYRLCAVIYHEGSANAGHYYAAVKGPNGIWSVVDDPSVEQMGLNFELHSMVYAKDASILVYQKVDGKKDQGRPPRGATSERVMLDAVIELKGKDVYWSLHQPLELPQLDDWGAQPVKFVLNLKTDSGTIYRASANAIMQQFKRAKKRKGEKGSKGKKDKTAEGHNSGEAQGS